MGGWFANVSDRKQIEIPEIGGWIQVRSELSVGEQRLMFSRAFKGQVTLENGEVRNEYDMREISFGQVFAYLVDWSDKAPITLDAIKALKPDVYGPIEAAVQKHIESLPKPEASPNAPAPTRRHRKGNGAPTLRSAGV